MADKREYAKPGSFIFNAWHTQQRRKKRNALEQRIFIDLKSVTQEHYTLQNPVVETGDFSHSVDFVYVNGTSIVAIMGSAVTDTLAFWNDGSVRLYVSNSLVFSIPSSSFVVGALNSLTYTRSGSSITTLVNGASSISGTTANNVVIDEIGASGGSLHFNGIIANVDLGNGNDWKLDRDPENTEQATNGSNLLTYVNIPTGLPTRELFTINQAGTQGVGNNGTTLVIA